MIYIYINHHAQPPIVPQHNHSNTDLSFHIKQGLKKNQNAPRPSEHPPLGGEKMSKSLGGIKGCKYKTSSWHLNGFPYGGDIGSTV